MSLPFTTDQFLEVFRHYNMAVWPAQWVLVGLALVVVVLALRSGPRDHRRVNAILALLWFWMAFVYHLAFFASVNRVAILFAAMFTVQGVLFLQLMRRSPPSTYRPRSLTTGVVGTLLLIYALIGYPMLGVVFGHLYPAAPTFGVPCPTTIFTLGMLVWSIGSVPRRILVIPLAWAVVGTTAAVTLGMVEDLGLLAAAIMTAGVLGLARGAPGFPDTASVAP